MTSQDLLPAQLWTIETPVGPFTDQINNHVLSWAREMGLVRSARAEERLRAVNVGEFTSRVYPVAGRSDAYLAADWIVWLDCLDDQNDDDPVGFEPDGFGRSLWLISDSGLGRTGVDAGGPLGRALADLLHRSAIRSSDDVSRRLGFHVDEYLVGNMWQASYRHRSERPDLGHYSQMRRQAGGILVTFDLVEVTGNIALPTSLYYSRSYQKALMAAADVVCWTNDLLTLEKELDTGDILNLVLAINETNASTIEQTLRRARQMTGKRVEEFFLAEEELNLTCDISAIDQDSLDALQRCMQGLRSWMRGHADWGLTTSRYAATASFQRPTYLENLFPGVVRGKQRAKQ